MCSPPTGLLTSLRQRHGARPVCTRQAPPQAACERLWPPRAHAQAAAARACRPSRSEHGHYSQKACRTSLRRIRGHLTVYARSASACVNVLVRVLLPMLMAASARACALRSGRAGAEVIVRCQEEQGVRAASNERQLSNGIDRWGQRFRARRWCCRSARPPPGRLTAFGRLFHTSSHPRDSELTIRGSAARHTCRHVSASTVAYPRACGGSAGAFGHPPAAVPQFISIAPDAPRAMADIGNLALLGTYLACGFSQPAQNNPLAEQPTNHNDTPTSPSPRRSFICAAQQHVCCVHGCTTPNCRAG